MTRARACTARTAAFATAAIIAVGCEGKPIPPKPLPAAAPRVVPFPAPAKMPARLLRSLAHDPNGYQPEHAPAATDILLGDLLFHSPEILGEKAKALGLSCQSCHPNGATHATFTIEGLSDRPGNVDLSTGHFRAGAENGIADPINIPSLRGVRYTAPYGRDGRTASLAEFTAGVVSSEFGGPRLSDAQARALITYVEELDFLPNRSLDSHGRLAATAGEAARRGEALFAAPRKGFDGNSCASCHPPSSWFRDGLVHRLGSGAPASPYSFDDGYETPTLLGLGETAPYFHDGRFATLAEVVDWFDRSFALALTPGDRADLTAYLDAIGDVPRDDDRPLPRRMVETFVYLQLLVDGETRYDRAICQMVVDRVLDTMDSVEVVPSLSARIGEDRTRLAGLRATCGAVPALSSDIEALRVELTRLAADWGGALAAR